MRIVKYPGDVHMRGVREYKSKPTYGPTEEKRGRVGAWHIRTLRSLTNIRRGGGKQHGAQINKVEWNHKYGATGGG